MARKRTSHDSTVARANLARENEELVIAENALAGERLIATVRIALFFLIMLSMNLATQVVGRSGGGRDPSRIAVTMGYLAFAVVVLLVLKRQRPDPQKALWAPLGMMLVDFAFFTFQGWKTLTNNPNAGSQTGAAVFSLLICFSVARFSRLHVVVSTGLACFSYMWLGMTYRPEEARQHFFVMGVMMALGLLIGLTQQRVRHMFLDLRRRDNLTRFLPKQVAERVMTLGDTSLAPVQREVTVMFTDIRDFTTLSENLPPNAVLKFLDEYFGHMAQLVKGHEGIVNKFLGDGLLACWGVPERLDNHAVHAVKAALDMRRVVEELNSVRLKTGAPPIKIGIGVHTGTVAAGMLGGAEQHEYTVIGDAVNLTARIEGLTKSYGVDILVSQSTWDQLDGRFPGERIGECQVKGRAEPVVVYRLDAPAQQPDALRV